MWPWLLLALLGGESSATHEARHAVADDPNRRDDELDREWGTLSHSPRWYAEEHSSHG